jgi:hypothetical protein
MKTGYVTFSPDHNRAPRSVLRLLIEIGQRALWRRLLLVSLCLLALGAGSKFWLGSLLPVSAVQAGKQSNDDLWQEVSETAELRRQVRQTKLQSARTLRLNQDAMQRLLRQAPLEFSDAAKQAPVVISIPLPDGSFARFQIEESPIMAPELAAQFPEIKTYRGQGVDDPAATARFDWTPNGFHAIVFSAEGSVYLDPYAKGDTAHYSSYYRRDYQKDGAPFECLVSDANTAAPPPASPQAPAVVPQTGATLRTYRLALAATVEYTQAAGGTKAQAMSRMTTTMNRINGIFERDLAVRMTLVANNSNIIYTAESDPYTNVNKFQMLNENQTNLDNVIGNANYDIGHVFGTGGGGIGMPQSPCDISTKAQGVSGSSNPTGYSFDVELVAHEMGHQFGAQHTFNDNCNTTGSSPRTGTSAYEPGSGSTIMSYAGNCVVPQNLQFFSNDYFHVDSLERMLAHINGAGNCAAQTANGNKAPVVNAGADYNIPKGTPFTLTATATDPNGDALTYAWEEYDLGPAAPPNDESDGQARPLFRSYEPMTSNARTFPRLDYILNNANVPPATYGCFSGTDLQCITGEILPAITRTMNFQVTVRDNRAGGGGVHSDQMQVNVTSNSGPFVVTTPNTALSWTGYATQTVTWNVANTTAAPVNASRVSILLSTDGGTTFPTVLCVSTANDGSEQITVPNTPTTQARIKVAAVGNIFFDISDSNFTITSGGGCTYAINPGSRNFPAAGGLGAVNVTAGGGCAWTALNHNPELLSITGGGTGTGNGAASYGVSSHTSASPRVGSLTVGGQSFIVRQGVQFLDVPVGAQLYEEIGKLSAVGITGGCGGNNYCPNSTVTREQMAAFIIRALHSPGYVPPTNVPQRFGDVPPSNPFYGHIEEMAVRQITSGCSASNYCPMNPVTREQMAAFIIRALHPPGYVPPTNVPQRFGDVPLSNPFYGHIEEMAARGITLGCGGGKYCPTQSVTRAQMAAFLVRAFNL